jgi:polar amino acid transport system permease protein
MSTIELLWTWTPFLLQGFAWNVLIALTAGLLGLLVGIPLAWCMQSGTRWVAASSNRASSTIHHIPTFALIFYMAVILPAEVTVPGMGIAWRIPTWIKVALALSAMQIGYVSANFSTALQAWRNGDRPKALLFGPGWVNGFLFTAIASSNASVVGVNELISRCNTVIAAHDQSSVMIPVYFYGSLFFLAFCFPLAWSMGRLKKRWVSRAKAQ